jgi:hypothetical protein
MRKTIDDASVEEWHRLLRPAEAEERQLSTANSHQIAGDHYASKQVQPWDYIIANNLGYLEGNIVKYVSRWREKGGVDDLRKARHYIDKLIEVANK